jgi:hypothetical protein
MPAERVEYHRIPFFVAVKMTYQGWEISFPVNSKSPDPVQTHPLAIRVKDILLNNSQAIVLQAMKIFPPGNNHPGDGPLLIVRIEP